jgi:hypothetical protein
MGWGLNNFGQADVPAGLTNVIAIASGQFHSLALIGDGPPGIQISSANLTVGINSLRILLSTQSGKVYVLQHKGLTYGQQLD